MVLSRDVKTFTTVYGWVDGMVTSISWDSNLFDLLVTVYTYEGRDIEGQNLTIRFRNCIEANFKMTSHFHTVPRSELKNHMLSWYTITNYKVKEDSGFINIEIETADYNTNWLTVLCEEVWVEHDENSQ